MALTSMIGDKAFKRKIESEIKDLSEDGLKFLGDMNPQDRYDYFLAWVLPSKKPRPKRRLNYKARLDALINIYHVKNQSPALYIGHENDLIRKIERELNLPLLGVNWENKEQPRARGDPMDDVEDKGEGEATEEITDDIQEKIDELSQEDDIEKIEYIDAVDKIIPEKMITKGEREEIIYAIRDLSRVNAFEFLQLVKRHGARYILDLYHRSKDIYDFLFSFPVFEPIRKEYEEQYLFIKNGPNIMEGGIACRRCGSLRTVSTHKQTRAADEPDTIFVTCYDCNHHWRS